MDEAPFGGHQMTTTGRQCGQTFGRDLGMTSFAYRIGSRRSNQPWSVITTPVSA